MKILLAVDTRYEEEYANVVGATSSGGLSCYVEKPTVTARE